MPVPSQENLRRQEESNYVGQYFYNIQYTYTAQDVSRRAAVISDQTMHIGKKKIQVVGIKKIDGLPV